MIKEKKIAIRNRIALKKKKRARRTFFAFVALIILESCFYFFGKSLTGGLILLLFLAIFVSAMVIGESYFNLKYDSGYEKSISYFKMMAFLAPLVLLAFELMGR